MSRTDRHRPHWVAESDPYNRRFRMVGVPKECTVAGDEWHWKKLVSKCRTCCSQKFVYQWDDGRRRAVWRQERQELLKTWREEFDD